MTYPARPMRPPAAALALLLALPLAAHAQSSDARAEAEKRFAEGKRLFDERKFHEARNRFLEACAVLDTAACPKNLGVVEGELGMLAESATHLRQYLEDKRSHADPVRIEIAKELSELRKRLGELDIVASPGARIRLDDQIDLGKGPLTHTTFVLPGKHQVSGIWNGGGKTVEVVAEAGALTKVDVTDPGASIANGPAAPPPAQTESHRVAFPPPAGAIVLGGLGLVGLGLGIGLGAASAGKKSEMESLLQGGACATVGSPRCLEAADARSAGQSLGAAGVASYVIGGLALAAGVVWWIAAPRTRTISVGAGGALLGGTF